MVGVHAVEAHIAHGSINVASKFNVIFRDDLQPHELWPCISRLDMRCRVVKEWVPCAREMNSFPRARHFAAEDAVYTGKEAMRAARGQDYLVALIAHLADRRLALD